MTGRGFDVIGTSLSPGSLPDGDRMVVWLRVHKDGSHETASAHLSELRQVLAEADKQACICGGPTVSPLCKATVHPANVGAARLLNQRENDRLVNRRTVHWCLICNSPGCMNQEHDHLGGVWFCDDCKRGQPCEECRRRNG